jgi:Flp pilus assembly CpaE family ATPase
VPDLEKAFGQTVVAQLPNDGRIVPNSVNQGVPFMITNPGSAVAQAVRQLAVSLTQGGERREAKGESLNLTNADSSFTSRLRGFLSNCFAS